MREKTSLDEIDLKILSVLQNDARASFQDIGNAIGLSLSACHKRVRALENAGVVNHYAAILEGPALGFRTSAYVRVTLCDQTRVTLEAFEKAVILYPEIMECVLMSGDSDYFLRIVCRGVEDYERIHSEILTTLPGVLRVTSSFGLRTICRKTAFPIMSEFSRS